MNRRLVLGLVVFAAVPATIPIDRVGAEPEGALASLVGQDQFVAGLEGATFDLSVSIAGPSRLDLDPSTNIVVTSRKPVESRGRLHDVLSGEPTSVIDRVRIPLSLVPGSASGVVDLTIPIEIGSQSEERLQMSAVGLHPIDVGIEIDSVITDQFTTFVERLPAGETGPNDGGRLPVAIVGVVDGSLTLQSDATTTVDPVDQVRLRGFVATVESLIGIPLTVAVRPELVEGFVRSTSEDAALVDGLQSSDSVSYLSVPFVHTDPGPMAAAGTNDIFVGQLRQGEDRLQDVIPGSAPTRTSWLLDRPISSVGARFVRDLGYRSITLLADATDDGFEGIEFADPTRLVELDLGNGATIDALLADDFLSDLLSEGSRGSATEAVLTAQHVLADLKMLIDDVLDDDTLAGRALVLATRDGSLPATDFVVPLADTLASSGIAELVSLEDALAISRVGLVDGRPIVVDLPRDEDPTPDSLSGVLYETADLIDSFASVLPDGDERVTRWRRTLDVIPDQRLTEDDRRAYADSIRTETDLLAADIVVPTPDSLTLGGRSSEIRLSVRNDGDSELSVRVRLRSAKLRFPEGERIVVLLPGTSTTIEVPVEARSNGRFPVTLQLVTPNGERPISESVTFTARVNALAGLGQLVTGVALLLLATWWVHHLRVQRLRRSDDVDSTTRRHPSG